MIRLCRLFLRFAGPLLLAGISIFAFAGETREIGLLHVNDVYQIAPIDPKAPRGGLARLATLVSAVKRDAPATLFLFGGDTLSPSVESGAFKGRQMMAAWNALQLDAAVPGNHEFDFGEDVLRERLAESGFPWLAANMRADRPLPHVQPSLLRVVGGVRVGIVGLLTPDTMTLSKPGPRLHFEALLPAARREARALRAKGAEVLVALTHNTLAEDRQLAATGLFDLILGGHDHHLITEQTGRTLIFKAGSDARDVIHVRLRLEQAGGKHRLAGISWDLLPLDGRWKEDPAVLALAADFERQSGRLMAETVGETTVPLDARGETLRRGESNVGNFAADAVRAALGADVALLNAGGFRIDRVMEPGPLSRHDLLALLPFQNPLVLLSIKGAELLAALEHGIDLRLVHGQSGAFPHVSGLRVRYDPRAPKGSRIVDAQVNGAPLERDRSYRLATSNYLAGGGDGYAVLKALPVLRPAEGSPTETDVVIEAVAKAGRIAPALDGRMGVAP